MFAVVESLKEADDRLFTFLKFPVTGHDIRRVLVELVDLCFLALVGYLEG